jgi:hypothetical protein
MKRCEKCGLVYNDDVTFCGSCGSRLPDYYNDSVNNAQEKPINKKIIIGGVAVVIVVLIIFLICNSKSGGNSVRKYDGYYIGNDLYVEIQDGTIRYWGNGQSYYYDGFLEKNDSGNMEIYFTGGHNTDRAGSCNPIHAELVNDGEVLILTSDSSSWSTDTLSRVSASECASYFEDKY